jgi:uncharacterized protein YggE
MKKVLTYSLAALILCASTGFAKEAYADRVATNYMSPAVGCMTENAQVSVNFNGIEQDVNTIKTKFDAKVTEIEKLFKEAALEKFEMQSMNYNINPQNYGGGMNSTFQFSGNLSFTVLPSSKATALMAELTKKGYQASVNVSAYRNSGVPCSPATEKQG